MTLSTEQLALRRTGITATDMAKIAGVSPYGGAQDVLDEKRGIAPPFDETDRVKWGNILEGPIRDDYAERHGVTMTIPGTIRHSEYKWALATPDAAVWKVDEILRRLIRGWECKTHTIWLASDYGEPGTDEVPPHEVVQCAWNMFVSGLDEWDLTVFIDNIPRDYRLFRDDDLERQLFDLASEFYETHMVEGFDLEPDGTKSYSEALKRRFPKNNGMITVADDEVTVAIEDLRHIRAEIRAREATEEKLVQIIKEFIADTDGVGWMDPDDGYKKITWKKSKDGTKTDWKSAFNELAGVVGLHAAEVKALADVELAEIIKRHTKETKGSRRFVVPRSWNK